MSGFGDMRTDEGAFDDAAQALLHDFTRVHQSGSGTCCFEVAVVRWVGSHDCQLFWKPYRTWKTAPDAGRLCRVHQRVLRDPRFFRVCTICKATVNVGHLYDDSVCQTCAEQQAGVVY